METTGIVPSELDLRRGPQLVSPRPERDGGRRSSDATTGHTAAAA
jgi:hypothetical protein